MADPTTWSKVTVTMESAIATAKTLTAATKADPCVVTCTGHGLSDGAIVYIEAPAGMTQLNERAFRIANSATDTFELEGIDSTDFDTFTSATGKEVTLGTTIASATTISASGGDFGFIDITTIHDSIKKQIPDIPNAIVYNMDHLWDMTDAGQAAMKAASDVQQKKTLQVTFANGKKMIFNGYVGYAGVPGGSAGAAVTSQAVFTLNGTPTYYAS